jgi:membrane protease YdiL (CAAX protease family)
MIMFLKAAFKDSSVFIQFFLFVSILIFGSLLSYFVGTIIFLLKDGTSPEALSALLSNPDGSVSSLRLLQCISQIGTFVLPPLFCGYLFGATIKKYLQIDSFPFPKEIFWAALSMIFAIPVLNFIGDINQQLVLPEWLKGAEEWMRKTDELNTRLSERMMYSENLWVFLFNIVVIAVLPGIGEEFLFRGALQSIFGRVIKSSHIVIWLVAVIFSAFHLQFLGFIPRLLMGAYFGYLLYYTKNLWVPIIAHFTNNCIILIIHYTFQDSPAKIQEIDSIGYGSTSWLAAVSLALFVFCFWQISKQSKQKD